MTQTHGELSFGWRDSAQVNSAPTLADFDSKWLLLANSETIVHLWKVDDRVGFLDRSVIGESKWVWLTPEMLSRVKPYDGQLATNAIRPDLQLQS